MKSLLNTLTREAPYLDSSKDKFLLIGFLGGFTLVFFTVYSPFDMTTWGGFSIGYVGVGVTVLLFTQFLLRAIFKIKTFKLYQLILWGAGEVLFMAYCIYFIFEPNHNAFSAQLDEYLIVLKFVSLVIVFPYIVTVWYIAFKQKFFSYKKVVSDRSNIATSKNTELLTLTGENNKIILAINYTQLLYVKSSGNYLDVYYLKGEITSKELVRISLKEFEAAIKDSSIIRIHRSYMVNTHKISSFKKTRKGYKLVMQHTAEEILPVSLGYRNQFEKALELNVTH